MGACSYQWVTAAETMWVWLWRQGIPITGHLLLDSKGGEAQPLA